MAWRLTGRQIVWVVGIVVALLILVLIGVWLWGVLAGVLVIDLAVIGGLLWRTTVALGSDRARLLTLVLAIGPTVIGALFWWLWGALVGILAITLTLISGLLWWQWDILARLWWRVGDAGYTTRIITIAAAIGIAAIGILFWRLWDVLANYIQPDTSTEKKDLVNVFVLMAAGVVGALTAIAAVGNLIVSRRNLRQQADLDELRAHADALQAYFTEIGSLLTEHKLMETKCADDPIRLLARAQTLSVLERLGRTKLARGRKRELIRFLYDVGLINKGKTIVNLDGAELIFADLGLADLSGADLSGADLTGADLRYAKLNGADFRGAGFGLTDVGATNLSNAALNGADFRGAGLYGANLSGARLEGAKLIDANLLDANLTDASVSGEQLLSAGNLEGATMPNGQKYVD